MYSHEEQSQGQPGGVFSRGHSGTEMITNHLKLCVCMLCAAVCVHVDLSLVSSHFSKIDCTNACTAVYSLSIFVASDHAPFPLKRTSEYCCVVWRFRAHRCGMEMRSRKEVVNIVRVIWNHVPLQAHTVTLPRFATGRTPHWHTPWRRHPPWIPPPPNRSGTPRLITRLDSCMVTGVARSAVRLKEDVSCFERCPTHHTLSMRLSHVQTHPSFIATNVGSWIGTSETKKQVPLYAALLGNRTTSLETIESFCWSTVSQMLYMNEKLIGFAPCTLSSHMAS